MSDEISLAIQVGSNAPKVLKNVTLNDIEKLVAKESESMADRLRLTHNRIERVSKHMTVDPDLAVEYFQLKQKEASRDELLGNDLANYTAANAVKRIEQYHDYSDVGSVLLYKDAGFKGKSRFFSVTWPNFKWPPYCFNDAASSAKAWGANIIFEHSWYRGRRMYLIGLPYFEAPNLAEFGFNDIASSFASVP